MARREVKVPLARLWILLSYSERSDRFCRSWKASGRTQLILLAFKSLWADRGWVVRGSARNRLHQHGLGPSLARSMHCLGRKHGGTGALAACTSALYGKPRSPTALSERGTILLRCSSPFQATATSGVLGTQSAQ